MEEFTLSTTNSARFMNFMEVTIVFLVNVEDPPITPSPPSKKTTAHNS